ncbi:MAG: hypothetical protein ABI688_01160 [Bacteroidota bacterium]
MTSKKLLFILSGVILLATYFLPWVVWGETKVGGYAMASGDFFKLSESQLDLANPFPKLSFLFFVFWLVPALAILTIVLAITNKKQVLLPFITGGLSLSLVTVYVLFSDFGAGKPLGLMKTGIWLHILAAIGLIVLAAQGSLLKKATWIIAGPVLVFACFKLTEKYIMNETHKETVDLKADHTIRAEDLIKEFISNDTNANKKYREKVLIVNGNTAAVDLLDDSTSTIKFADSTGSFAIFSLEKTEMEKVKGLRAGDAVSLKGICSGSIFSEILGTTSISFKRSTFNKK